MKRFIRPVWCILAVILLAAPGLSGCGLHLDAKIYAQGFLNCIAQKDYKGAYERTYPYSAQTLPEDDFVKKYTDIFTALKITGVNIGEGQATEEKDGAAEYTYTAKYVSEKYGTFTNNFTMTLRAYEDTMKVDWTPSLIFPGMDFGDSVSVSALKASRGEIITSDSVALAKNDYAQTVYVNLTKAKTYEAFAPALCEKLSLKAADVKKKYDAAVKNKDDILLVQSYPKETFDEAKIEELQKIPGVDVDGEKYTPLRYYPLREAAAHIVGYTGAPDEKEAAALKKKGLDPNLPIGQEGLEQAYESTLRGTDGEAVYIRDENGRIKSAIYKKDAANGTDLILSIDSRLQEKAYTMLATQLSEGMCGTAIVMNPQTGAIQAAVSYPSYDNNKFLFPIDKATWDNLTKKESLQPMFNRLTQGLYEPGSVIKPFTYAAALEQGVVKPDDAFPYENEIKADVWKPDSTNFPDWGSNLGIKRVENSGSPLKLRNALLHSDNIYFAWTAMLLGKDKMMEYLQKYTFAQKVDFDLPLKTSNIINSGSEIYLRLLAEMGYGQGNILVTPIQMAAMYTAFTNHGDMVKPYLVAKEMRADGLKYEAVKETATSYIARATLKQSSLDTLLPLMEDVVSDPEGTGHRAQVAGVRIAGKTGTAQRGDKKSEEISWFAGFWVDQKEPRLVLVMVDVPANQGTPKFAIAKELLTPPKADENSGPATTGQDTKPEN